MTISSYEICGSVIASLPYGIGMERAKDAWMALQSRGWTDPGALV